MADLKLIRMIDVADLEDIAVGGRSWAPAAAAIPISAN